MKKLITFATAVCLIAMPGHAAEEAKDDGRVEISRGKYITGGILGTAIGFGIGHGVQGRYGEKGWIFTATEATATVVIFGALARCWNRAVTDSCSSEAGTLGLSYAALIGFHVWEIVDVWTGARPVDDKKASFMIIPDPKAPTALVSWRF